MVTVRLQGVRASPNGHIRLAMSAIGWTIGQIDHQKKVEIPHLTPQQQLTKTGQL
jgi:hypothetical protein